MNDFITYENSIDNYVSFKDACVLLNFTMKRFTLMINKDKTKYDVKFITGEYYLSKTDLTELQDLQKEFWNIHYSLKDAKKKFKNHLPKGIEIIEIPWFARDKKNHFREKYACNKKEVDLTKEQILIDDCISFIDACELLNLHRGNFQNEVNKFKSKYNVRYVKYSTAHYYLSKAEVNKLYCLQQEFWNEHYSSKEAKKKFNSLIPKEIKIIEIPWYARDLKNHSKERSAYKKEEVDFAKKRILTNDYISFLNVCKLLNLSRTTYLSVLKNYNTEYDIKYIEYNGVRHYLRRAKLKELQSLQQKFWNEHYSLQYIKKKFNDYIPKEIEIIEIPWYAKDSKNHHNEKYACKKEEVDFIKEQIQTNSFISFKDACKLLNLGRKTYELLVNKSEVEYDLKYIQHIDSKGYVSNDNLKELQSLQQEFWNIHYSLKDAKKKLKNYIPKGIGIIEIPWYARDTKNHPQAKYACKKEEVEFIKEQIYTYKDSLKSKYMSFAESRKLIGLSYYNFYKFVQLYGIETKSIRSRTYYLKDDIYFFKEQQSHLGDRYISTNMAIQRYKDRYHNISQFLFLNVKSKFEIPLFCRNPKIVGSSGYCYDSEEIESFIMEKEFKNKVLSIFGKTDFDTFKLRIELYNEQLKILGKSLYTKGKWLNYVSLKITQSGIKSKASKEQLISIFVSGTLELEGFMALTNIDEVYSLTADQINLWFKKMTNSKKRMYFYKFLESVYEDIQLRLKSVNSYNKGFNFEKIKRFDDKEFQTDSNKNNDEVEIYDYDTYLKIFRHLINIPLHVKRSIFFINENNNDISYLSTWLYVLLHLNNGWRHGDVVNFPRLYFSDLLTKWGILNIDWFTTNAISIEKSRRIISRITQYDFRISKTEVFGHFFCSDKLAQAISTAILMIECFYQHYKIDKSPDYNDPIMKYKKCKYNEPTPSLLEKCFRGCKISDFKFSSRKMNRTVLTFLYNIANSILPSGYNSLLLPKYLRAHIEEMSTIQYIQFSSEQLEFLSGELFQRGEFGFITDMLLNLISNKPNKSLDRTEEIKSINRLFGDSQKIENICGMLNFFNNEKEEIMQILNKYTYNECIKMISNIYTNNLPSRQPDIQCLFSKIGCQCPDSDCVDCKYKIPNIYILRTLCMTLREEMDLYIHTRHIGKKIKLSTKIHRKVDILMESIKKYGKEYVYNCMDMERNDFLDLFDKIMDTNELLRLI